MKHLAFFFFLSLTSAAIADSVSVLVELHETPAAVAYIENAGSKSAGQAQLRRVQAEQDKFLAAFAQKSSVDVLYRTQALLNAVALRLPEAALAEMQAGGRVKAVHALGRYTVGNAESMPFLDIPLLWNPAGAGLTGEGISIGIIDTGIDYLHPDFGGNGSDGDHARNNTTILGDVPFPTPKIAGGFDFVGDSYDPDDPAASTPVPDPDPMDQHGHGTHVAGTAAGFGVNSDGTTYTGAYAADTPVADMLIGPGAAPEATLYALKIFGKSGSSQVLLPAMDWAADPNQDGDFSDRLDVVNLSLGDAFGLADTPESEAADNLAKLGVIVVSAAGNAGDLHFIVNLPAASPWSICVAAAAHRLDEEDGFTPDLLANFSSRGPALTNEHFILKPDVTAPGVDVVSANAHAANPDQLAGARRGTSMATPHVAGLAALLRQQYPDWTAPEIKSLIVTTATNPVYRFSGFGLPLIAPAQAGAGRIDPLAALASDTLAFDAAHPEQVSVTFATREVADTALEQRAIRIWNRGPASEAYSLRLVFRTFINGVSLRLSETQTEPLAPGDSVDIGLRLDALASVMRNTRDSAARDGVNGLTRQWLNEVSGYVVVTPLSGAPPLHVPFYGALRPVADMAAADIGVDLSTEDSAAITLSGEQLGPGTGDHAFEFLSLVTPLELLSYIPAPLDAAPTPTDLRFVGINSDYLARRNNPEDEADDAQAFFGIAVQEDWNTLNRFRYTVNLDMDQDSVADFALYTSGNPLSNVRVNRNSDVHLVRLTDFDGQDDVAGFVNVYPPDVFHTAPFFSNVLVLPLTLSSVAWEEGQPFDFWVTTSRRGAYDQVVDTSATLTWNPAEPGIQFPDLDPDMVLRPDLDGAAIPVGLDWAAYRNHGSLGVLLLHHHNASGEKAEWLPVITPGDSDGDSIPDAIEGAEDRDGDGLANLWDSDSDGDGLLDSEEGSGDTDGDETPDFLDTDSDNDGLDDGVEAGAGTDAYNSDTDGDGRSDGEEGLGDADGDGIVNALDEDSDGDGIPDALEADGDRDNDGLDNFLDLDSDGDGIPDGEEGLGDLDADGVPNYLDTDSDGDGLEDSLEVQGGTDPYAFDSDRDGRSDGVEGLGDADSDGVPNALDLDSDGDGIPDALEPDGDPDGDGLPNFLDPDSDNDSLQDGEEGMEDLDGDGLPNFLDTDSDWDTVLDIDEVLQHNTNPLRTDTDFDARDDKLELVTGTDPTQPDLPDAPEEVVASDGVFNEYVLVRWKPGLGNVQWRVWRGPVDAPETATPLSDWMEVVQYKDFTTDPPTFAPGSGCAGPSTKLARYVYFVEARNGIGTSELSAYDEGHRGGEVAVAGVGAVVIVCFSLCIGRIRKRHIRTMLTAPYWNF